MVFDPGKIILRGRDVALRPLERTDAPELAITAAESREQYRFTIVPSDPAEAYQYIERAIEQRNEGQRYPFAVVFLGRVVGSTSYLDLRPLGLAGGGRDGAAERSRRLRDRRDLAGQLGAADPMQYRGEISAPLARIREMGRASRLVADRCAKRAITPGD